MVSVMRQVASARPGKNPIVPRPASVKASSGRGRSAGKTAFAYKYQSYDELCKYLQSKHKETVEGVKARKKRDKGEGVSLKPKRLPNNSTDIVATINLMDVVSDDCDEIAKWSHFIPEFSRVTSFFSGAVPSSEFGDGYYEVGGFLEGETLGLFKCAMGDNARVFMRCPDNAEKLYDAAKVCATGDGRIQSTGAVTSVLSFDSEYVRVDDETNNVVSYQITMALDCGYLVQFLFLPTKRASLCSIPDLCHRLVGDVKALTANCLFLSHFFGAEWSVLEDRIEVSRYLTDIRGTPATMGRGFLGQVFTAGKRRRSFRIQVRDTVLVSPGKGGSLSHWGVVLGYPKVVLEGDYIKRMNDLLVDKPALFARYAMTDTEVCLLAYGSFMTWCNAQASEYPGFRAGLTLGGSSVNLYTAFKGGRAEVHKLVGMESVKYRDDKGRERRRMDLGSVRALYDNLAGQCYHGGYNTSFYHGLYKAMFGYRVYDVDLSGAYAGAMGLIDCLDFSKPPETTTKLSHILKVVETTRRPVVAWVKFSFPETELYPCLPVNSTRGLQYVLEGESYCTGPELLLAARAGAQIEVFSCNIWHTLDKPLYADYIGAMMAERHKYDKKTLFNLLFKDMSNTLYGKVAQGIKTRRITNFSRFDGPSRELEGSLVTLPIAAAMITGYIRAALFDINSLLRAAGCQVLTTTTDGSLIGAPRGMDFNAVVRGGYAHDLLSEGRLRLGMAADEADKILEVKCEGASAGVWRTRANSVFNDDGVAIHNARGGLRFDGIDDERSIGERMLDIIRDGDVINIWYELIVKPKSISHDRHKDIVNNLVCRLAQYDFDFKRSLLFNGWSVPFRTVDEVHKAQERGSSFRRFGHHASYENLTLSDYGFRLNEGANSVLACVKISIMTACCQEFKGWSWPGGDITIDVPHKLFESTLKYRKALKSYWKSTDKNRITKVLPATHRIVAYVREAARYICGGTDEARQHQMILDLIPDYPRYLAWEAHDNEGMKTVPDIIFPDVGDIYSFRHDSTVHRIDDWGVGVEAITAVITGDETPVDVPVVDVPVDVSSDDKEDSALYEPCSGGIVSAHVADDIIVDNGIEVTKNIEVSIDKDCNAVKPSCNVSETDEMDIKGVPIMKTAGTNGKVRTRKDLDLDCNAFVTDVSLKFSWEKDGFEFVPVLNPRSVIQVCPPLVDLFAMPMDACNASEILFFSQSLPPDVLKKVKEEQRISVGGVLYYIRPGRTLCQDRKTGYLYSVSDMYLEKALKTLHFNPATHFAMEHYRFYMGKGEMYPAHMILGNVVTDPHMTRYGDDWKKKRIPCHPQFPEAWRALYEGDVPVIPAPLTSDKPRGKTKYPESKVGRWMHNTSGIDDPMQSAIDRVKMYDNPDYYDE